MSMIYKDNLYFPSIIGVDRARRIEDCDPVSQCEAGSGANLAFEARR